VKEIIEENARPKFKITCHFNDGANARTLKERLEESFLKYTKNLVNRKKKG